MMSPARAVGEKYAVATPIIDEQGATTKKKRNIAEGLAAKRKRMERCAAARVVRSEKVAPRGSRWFRDETLTVVCLAFLGPQERLGCCSVSRSWLALRKRRDMWSALAFRSQRVRSPRVASETATVTERSLTRLASTLALDGLEQLALEDSPGRTTGGVGYNNGWRKLLFAIPVETTRLRSVRIKGRVFKTAAFRLIARKFGPGLEDFECHNDSPGLVAELLSHCPRLASLGVDHLGESTCDAFSTALSTARNARPCLRILRVLTWATYSDTKLARSMSFDYLCADLGNKFPDLERADLKKVLVNPNGVSSRVFPLSNLKSLSFSFRLWFPERRRRSENDAFFDVPESSIISDFVAGSVAKKLVLACPVLESLVVEFEATADATILPSFLDAIGDAAELRTLALRGLRARAVPADAECIGNAVASDTCAWPANLSACNVVFSDLSHLGVFFRDKNNSVCSWGHSVVSLVWRHLFRIPQTHQTCYRPSPTQRLHVGTQIRDTTSMISNLANVRWLESVPRLVR